MEQLQQTGLHIRCQKNKTIDFEQKPGESRDGRVEWKFSQENAQGTFTITDIPNGFSGRLSLKLCNQPLDENYNLAMESPVTVELCVKEKPEKITAMYLFNNWWTRPAFIDDFIPEKEKFPNGFAGMIRDIKQEGNISWFGVWHALGGYWGGVLPDSPLAEQEQGHLYPSVSGGLLPSPQKEQGFGFYSDWYRNSSKAAKNLFDGYRFH